MACLAGMATPGDPLVGPRSGPPPAATRESADRFPPPVPVPNPEQAAVTNMVIRPAGAGVFEIGRVRLSKSDRTVTFPAVVNARQGPMEYFLVAPYGATHESVLRTEAQPYHVHIAMLLLDARGDPHPPGAPGQAGFPTRQIENPWKRAIGGDPITVEVAWIGEGRTNRHRAEDLVYNLAEHAPMVPGPWTYSGSLIVEGTFIAQGNGAIAALIGNPSALINNPRKGSENDDIWTVNTNALPPVGTPVEVTLRLE